MIELKALSNAYESPDGTSRPVLSHVDLTLGPGEFAIVIGPNGCGKSTLLNAISGRVEVQKGSILIDGKDMTRVSECRRAAYIGKVVQNPAHGTAPSLTVGENMRLAALRGHRRGFAVGLRPAERAEFGDRLRTCGMGLEDRLDQLSGTLSGGQRQALALILATLETPRVLLLDEHTAALDPKAADQVARLTESLVASHQLTTLMVTHSMAQAASMGSRLLIMHHGRIQTDLPQGSLSAADLVDRLHALYQAEVGHP